jgi:hypothetical protein
VIATDRFSDRKSPERRKRRRKERERESVVGLVPRGGDERLSFFG